MMACLVMSQSVGVIIGAMVAASCATYHFRGQRKKSDPGPARYYFECCIEGTDSSAVLRSEEIDAVEGISRTLRGHAQAGGSGEISVRRIDPKPSTRSLTSELHAQTFPLGTGVRYCRR
jgi:hypothetical protein